MLSNLIAKCGLSVSKGAVIALAVAALIALGGLGAWRAMARIDAMERRAADAAAAARDAHWSAEIARSNAAVERQRAEQAITAAAAEHAAAAEIATLKSHLTDLEHANAALPNGDRCGIGRDRIRLLK